MLQYHHLNFHLIPTEWVKILTGSSDTLLKKARWNPVRYYMIVPKTTVGDFQRKPFLKPC